MKKVIDINNISLHDLLTTDTHSKIIYIQDSPSSKPYKLIESRQAFFRRDGLFANVEKNKIKVLNSDFYYTIDIDEFLKELAMRNNSTLLLIEGFAGCGKSTLVQYILSKQLQTYNYDYSLFNYDIEAINDINIRDRNGNIIKRSSIFEAIKKAFIEQLVTISLDNISVLNDFCDMLNMCNSYQPFNSLYFDFYNTDSFDEIESNLKKTPNNAQKKIIQRLLYKQINHISSSICILALDYLLRLSMYKNRVIDKLIICYDNLDAIEDADDLKNFDDVLANFRGLIDEYIIHLQYNDYFSRQPSPCFIIMATYRKITASLVNIAETAFKEVKIDKNSEFSKEHIYYLDATSAFLYSKIVEKRKKYFDDYFKNVSYLSDKYETTVKKNFDSWYKLNEKLEIMQDRYACLWNKNYRTCSLIANELYTKKSYDFKSCVEFIDKSNTPDGYDETKDKKGNRILSSYFGGSAIILSSVCKVFHNNHIWDDFLDLAPLNTSSNSHKNISLSRIILTYMYNKKTPVSLEELYNMFCKNNLFDSNKLCHILSKMLARNLNGVWRRPIYYADKCILSENAINIENELLEECSRLAQTRTTNHDYKFLLCDSGKSYVERLMQEFEFYSNRISNNNKALYLYTNIDDIKSILDNVYIAVLNCCKNMQLFRREYMNLSGISAEDYLKLPIHPTTNITHSHQLHTERTIFSHIAYLNKVRKYFTDKNICDDINDRKNFNKVFVEYIDKYLSLYDTYVLPISSQRSWVAENLKSIINSIKLEMAKTNGKIDIIFKSISLS